MTGFLRDRWLQIAAPALLFVTFAILWQLVAFNFRSILPPLEAVGGDLAARPDFYLRNLWVTLSSALAGFVIGGSLAILLAIAMVHFAFVRSAVMPFALLLNVTPVVAISPALIVAFGFNAIPHIIVAGIAAFFPMLINAIAGLRTLDPQTHEVLRSMSASRLDILIQLRLPGGLPYLFTGARLSITAAMIGSVVSEFTGTAQGIGAAIVTATTYLNLAQMWGAIFISALATLILVGIVAALEKWLVYW